MARRHKETEQGYAHHCIKIFLPTQKTKGDNVSLVVSTVKTNRDVLVETVEIETLDLDHVETNQDHQALDNVIGCFWQSVS